MIFNWFLCLRVAIAADILSALRAEAVAGGIDPNQPPKLQVEAECTYYSPTDDMVMEQVRQKWHRTMEFEGEGYCTDWMISGTQM